jgi:endonuclease/exonuclease/phosphatase (EEP) superfamily protein YafD
MTKFLLSSSLLVLASASKAQNQIPVDQKVLIQKGHAKRKALPSEIQILVWNIHKAQDGRAWQNDFHRLSSQSDLILLQEGHEVPHYEEVTGQLPDFLWSFATSFLYQGRATGVVTGASTTPLKTTWLRSPVREPIANSPKMALFSEFDLENQPENLLAINIHAINFVTNSSFYRHIDQVLQKLEEHKGPILFAGDFNTWNSSRLNYLLRKMTRLNIQHVEFENDQRFMPLDHVFFRGLKIQTKTILESIKTSDHYPIVIKFSTVLH